MALKSKYFWVHYTLWLKKNQDTSLFLLYPESIPSDWEMKLELLGIPIAISPLHDKDIDTKKWWV